MICPKCKQANDDSAKFCAHCGESMTSASAASSGPGAAAGATAAASAAAAGAAASAAWAGASKALPGILERIKNILLTPKSEWAVIETEPTSVPQLYQGYVVPLAALAAIMSFLHRSVIGIGSPFGGTFRTPFLSGIVMAVVGFGLALLGLFLVGLIINGLAPTFGGEKNQRQALKTAAYAFTPAWIASVFVVLGGVAALLQFAAGIYGIYLLYLGLPLLMKSPREKATGYTVAVVVCTIVVGVIFGILSSRVIGIGGYGYGGLGNTSLSRAERQQQAAANAASIIGGVLGSDQQSKDKLGAALNNLAQAGQQIQQQQAAATPPPADSSNPQTAAAATAGMLTALGGAMSGGRHVDPVDFHTLKDLLPVSLPGLQRTDASGSSQQAVGVKSSTASADYQGQSGTRAQLKISDVSGVAGLLDVAGAMVQNTASESDAGFEKTSTVGGRLVHEKYDNASKHGEVTVIVAKRFSVEMTGEGIDMATLEQDLGSVDLAKLESMKDSGAQPN